MSEKADNDRIEDVAAGDVIVVEFKDPADTGHVLTFEGDDGEN